ncbi:MAG: hypothetical protein AAGI01_15630 [Myxococcota bacterium]
MEAKDVVALMMRLGWSASTLAKHTSAPEHDVIRWLRRGVKGENARKLDEMARERFTVSAQRVQYIQASRRQSAVSMAHTVSVDLDDYRTARRQGAVGVLALRIERGVHTTSSTERYPPTIVSWADRGEVSAELLENGRVCVDDGVCLVTYDNLREAREIWSSWSNLSEGERAKLNSDELILASRASEVVSALVELEVEEVERRTEQSSNFSTGQFVHRTPPEGTPALTQDALERERTFEED